MATKRKFKRDYIILEAKDMNYRFKERVLPKAFAKVEINEEKSVVALYVENLKYMKDGYRVVAIQSDYETLDLGKIVLNEQGKGEFVLNLENDDVEIKAVALLYDKSVPLIGFKGSKIENYEEILFTGEEYEYVEVEDEYSEDDYIEIEDDEDEDDEFEEYEEIEYIEIEEDDEDEEYYEDDEDEYEEYEEIEYIEIEEDDEVEEPRQVTQVEPEYTRKQYTEVKKPKVASKNNPINSQVNSQPSIKKANKPQPVRNKAKEYTSQENLRDKPMDYDDFNKQRQPKEGSLLMPRQIKKGLKYFREVKPFVADYIEDVRWWKIEVSPTTLCGYTMPYLGYVNSLNYTMYSDSVMQSYKYRHYLYGVQYDEYNKRKNYIYAVPGTKNEQPDRGHTGFTVYQPCDTKNDNLGYWLCFIDCRTRRIIK